MTAAMVTIRRTSLILLWLVLFVFFGATAFLFDESRDTNEQLQQFVADQEDNAERAAVARAIIRRLDDELQCVLAMLQAPVEQRSTVVSGCVIEPLPEGIREPPPASTTTDPTPPVGDEEAGDAAVEGQQFQPSDSASTSDNGSSGGPPVQPVPQPLPPPPPSPPASPGVVDQAVEVVTEVLDTLCDRLPDVAC